MEFPHLQRVFEKFQARGFVVLAINVHDYEDDFVLPFMRNNHYGFTPLRGNDKWAKVFNVRGTPTNLLLDSEGRIIFRPRVHSREAERTLELEIEALLARAANK